ncbi:MAG: TonB-dependent receptor [Bacteroidetes bacterium]|nr:TonB-dependent receptor [Bacteroidota bacterium]
MQDKSNHTLPVADAAEIGTVMTLSKRLVLSAAIWWMDMSNELVYVGDDGSTESKGPSRRSGIDISARYQLSKNLLADADLNISRGQFIEKQFGKELSEDFYIPLAPTLTSSGGLTYTGKIFESSVRYRHISDRPANEDNSIIAKGYTLLDLSCAYKFKKAKFSLSVENLLNIEWNEAQFATESRLKNEIESVEELHYTPGAPLAIKLGVIVLL